MCVFHDKGSTDIFGKTHVLCICLKIKFFLYMGHSILSILPHLCLNFPVKEAYLPRPNWGEVDLDWQLSSPVVIGNTPTRLFNFPSSWPRQTGHFPLVSLGTNEAIFTLFNDSMHICRIDMHSGHDQHQIRNGSNYHWKYTHKWNFMVVAEPNGNNSLFIYMLTVLLHQLTHI